MYTSYTHTSNIDSLQVYISVSHEAHTQLKILQFLGPCYRTCINSWNLLTSCKENTQVKTTSKKLLPNLSLFDVSPLNLHHSQNLQNAKKVVSDSLCPARAFSFSQLLFHAQTKKQEPSKKLNCTLTGQIALGLSRFCSQA